MKVLKYVLAVIFIIGGLSTIFSNSIYSGVFSIILGIILIPKVSSFIKEKYQKWDTKSTRYSTYAMLLIVIGIFHNQPTLNNESKNNNQYAYQEYLDNSKQLNETELRQRSKLLEELKTTKTYNELVLKKVISSEYLILFDAVNYGTRANHINTKGVASSFISSDQQTNLKKSKNAEDKINFVSKLIGLSTPQNGGFSKEIIDVFDRYKKEYGLFNTEMVEVKSKNITPSFDMTAIFTLLNPRNKTYLNSLYEANKSVSNWLKDDLDYFYPFLAKKENYNNHLKNYYPNSSYLLRVDIKISAKKLYREYDSNEVLADEKYKGKQIAVTGVISDIGKDIFNDPYITLSGGYLDNVNCYFDKESIKIISKIRKGQKLTVIGKCNGKVITDVIIKDCEIWDK